MSQAKNKTIPTEKNVEDFLATIPEDQQRDSRWLIDVMSEVSAEPAVMWGSSIIGFGRYHYKYESGREGDMCRMGFSPRKGKFALYITYHAENYKDLLEQVGKHQTTKACLYIKRLADVDTSKLRELIQKTWTEENSKL